MTDTKRYRPVFEEANGPGPWPCYGCGEPVDPIEVLIHHKDGNHYNNNPQNLASMHCGCHTTLHNLQRLPYSEETRAKIGAASSRRTHSAETRAKMSATRLGRPLGPQSEEHIEALRAVRVGVPIKHKLFQCGDCSLVTTGAGLRTHQEAAGHVGKIDTGKRVHDN